MSETLLVLDIDDTLLFTRPYLPFDTTDKSIIKNQIEYTKRQVSLTEEKKYPRMVSFLRPYTIEFMETAFKVFDNVAIWTNATLPWLQQFLNLINIPKDRFLFIRHRPLRINYGITKNLSNINSEFPQIDTSKVILLDDDSRFKKFNPHQIVIPSFVMIENDNALLILQKRFKQLQWDLDKQIKQIQSSLPTKKRIFNPKEIVDRKFDNEQVQPTAVVHLNIFFHPDIRSREGQQIIPIIRPFTFKFISGLKKNFKNIVYVDWNDKRRRLLKISKKKVFTHSKPIENFITFASAKRGYFPWDFHTEPNTLYVHPFYKSDDDLLKVLLSRIKQVQWKSIKDIDQEIQKINKDTLHFRDISKTQDLC